MTESEMAEKDIVLGWSREQLRRLGKPDLAEKEKAYTKSPLRFYGVAKPEVNALAKDVKRQWRLDAAEDVLPVIGALWDSEFYEEKTLAVVLASLCQRTFDATHLKGVFQSWLNEATSWGHTDELCIRVIGMIAIRDLETFDLIASWADAEHLWTRRASLVAHLPAIRKNQPQLTHLERTCQRLVDDDDFFIRKAIGWVLRELSENYPDETERIILAIGSRASGLSIRESTRKMSQRQRCRILQAIKSQSHE